jgi:hypothetical protein
VGPIKPHAQEVVVRRFNGGMPSLRGGITWKDTWYSPVIERLQVTSLTITFMDGTTKVFQSIPHFEIPKSQ